MTSSARLEQFCDDWYSALNSRSTDAMLDLTTPDVLWDDTVFWPAALRGHGSSPPT